MWTHLPYLLQVQIALTLLWLFYSLAWQRETRFGLSRAYLLLSVPVALLLPLLHIPVFPGPEIPASLFLAAYSPLPAQESLAGASGPEARFWLCGLALAGSLVLSVAALFHALPWMRLMRRRLPSVSASENVRLVYTARVETACSLFGWVFLNRERLGERELPHVLQHEMAHVRLRHSWDRLLAEGVRILLWWNPAVWMWYRSLVEVHEFQADRAVLETNEELESYVQLLLRTGTQSQASLVSGFSYSLLRKRLRMIGTSHPGGWSRCKIALVVPLLGLLLGLFSFTRREAVLVDDLVPQHNYTVDVSDDLVVPGNDAPVSDGGAIEPGRKSLLRAPDTVRAAKIFVTTTQTRRRLVEPGGMTTTFSLSSKVACSHDGAKFRSDVFQAEDKPVGVVAADETDLRESETRRQAVREVQQANQRDLEADVRSQEARLRESEASIRQAEAQVRRQEARVREQEAKVRENEAALRQQEAGARRQTAQMRARQAEVRRQQAEVMAQAAEVRAQAVAVTAQAAEVRQQAAEVRRQAAAIAEQEAQERLQQAEVRRQQARVREQEAMTRAREAQNRQQPDPAGRSQPGASSSVGKLGSIVIIDGKQVDSEELRNLPNAKVRSIQIVKKEIGSEAKIIVATQEVAEQPGNSSPDPQPKQSGQHTPNESVRVPDVGKDPLLIVDGVRVGMDYLENAVPETIESITVLKGAKNNSDAKIIITTKKAAGVAESSGKPN